MSFLMKKIFIIKLVIYVSLFLITVQDYTNMLVYNIITSPFFVISTSSLSYQYHLRHKRNFFSLSFVIYFYFHLFILFAYVEPFSVLQMREKRKTRKYISIQPRHHNTMTPRRDENTLKERYFCVSPFHFRFLDYFVSSVRRNYSSRVGFAFCVRSAAAVDFLSELLTISHDSPVSL